MTTRNVDARNTSKEMARRAQAGNDNTRCPLCCNPIHAPWYVKDAHGRVVQGCVDASHAPAALAVGAYTEWYHRPVAREIRRQLARFGA